MGTFGTTYFLNRFLVAKNPMTTFLNGGFYAVLEHIMD